MMSFVYNPKGITFQDCIDNAEALEAKAERLTAIITHGNGNLDDKDLTFLSNELEQCVSGARRMRIMAAALADPESFQ